MRYRLIPCLLNLCLHHTTRMPNSSVSFAKGTHSTIQNHLREEIQSISEMLASSERANSGSFSPLPNQPMIQRNATAFPKGFNHWTWTRRLWILIAEIWSLGHFIVKASRAFPVVLKPLDERYAYFLIQALHHTTNTDSYCSLGAATLPANASFSFNCNSTRGAILVVETALERTEATRQGIRPRALPRVV